MEREVSSAMSIGITLVALAALISVIWVTVLIGNSVKVDAYNEANDIASNIASSQMYSIKYKEDIVMPKAAAYSLLTLESNYVSELKYTDISGNSSIVIYSNDSWKSSGYINKNLTSLQDILTNNMTGKVELYVEPLGDDTFTVEITDIK